MAMPTQTEEAKITILDIRMAVAVLVCFLVSTICSMLCCQDNTKISWRAGVNRIIITFIGGLVGICVIFLDNLIGNDWVMAILVMLGILVTLFLCKAAKVPYINARIGGVTFILVTCTFQSTARIYYGCFRLLSTIIGVLIVMLVTWCFSLFTGAKTEAK